MVNRKKAAGSTFRRAISTAYYALFHHLIHEAVSLMIPNDWLRPVAARAFDHSEMKRASVSFTGRLPANLVAAMPDSMQPSPDLIFVAESFGTLQSARHRADYDVSLVFTRSEARNFVQRAADAFEAWQRIRGSALANAYLVSLLLVKKWDR